MNAFEIAIMLEKEGEEFYRKQADTHINHLRIVFILLAEDEAMHAKLIENSIAGKYDELPNQKTLKKIKQLFEKDTNFSLDTKEILTQLDVYRLALVKEKESIDLYKEMLLESKNKQEKQLFTFLVLQEQEHFRILEELIIMVNRPNDWVEAAEFGKREEY